MTEKGIEVWRDRGDTTTDAQEGQETVSEVSPSPVGRQVLESIARKQSAESKTRVNYLHDLTVFTLYYLLRMKQSDRHSTAESE